MNSCGFDFDGLLRLSKVRPEGCPLMGDVLSDELSYVSARGMYL